MKKLSKRHELVVNMPYVLLHFLIQENMLELFCDNYVLEKVAYAPKYMYKEKPIELYIACAFYWHKTPEGHNFWRNLNMKYRSYLSTLNII